MKALLLMTFLVGTLRAEQLHWEVVNARAGTSISSGVQWMLTFRNISDRTLNVAEDSQIKGNALVNLLPPYNSSISCHTPKNLKVEPGATINAVHRYPSGFDLDKLTLAILEGDKWTVLGPLSKIATKGQQAGAGQPATASESKSEGKDKPQPESKVAPR
jgi:hypothetical protein